MNSEDRKGDQPVPAGGEAAEPAGDTRPPEPLQVEARVDAEGPPQPLAFLWRGQRLLIHSIGRTWQEAEAHHYLVMVAGDRVYELAYSLERGFWRVVREPGDFGPPGKTGSAA